MAQTTYHLTIALVGKPPHFCEGFTTLEEAQHAASQWANCSPPRIVTIHPPYREELTAAGPQLVIPGCERVAPDNGKPAQLSLFA